MKKEVIDIEIKYFFKYLMFLHWASFCKEILSNKKYAISKRANSNVKELNDVNKKALSTRCYIDIVEHCVEVNDVNYIIMVRGSHCWYGVNSKVDNINEKCWHNMCNMVMSKISTISMKHRSMFLIHSD